MRRHRIPVILVALAAAGLLAAGCSSPPDAGSTTEVSYLWVVNSEGGTVTGAGDTGLTLTLTGVRDYVTQFADRPVRHAYVLSTTDFATRWEQWFSPVTPNAVLSFTEPSSPMPASIVLEVTNPVYDKAARTLVFDAARLHREPDPHPDAVEAIALPNLATPASFISGALFIDSAADGSLPEPDGSDPAVPAASASSPAATTVPSDPPSPTPSPVPETASPDISESPAQEQPLAAPAGYRIGDTGPGGGIVFYDAGSVQPWGRYLEAAPARWSGDWWDPQARWCDRSGPVPTSDDLGAGAANTQAMLEGCTSGAGVLAQAYTGGGKTDWFLPSTDELNVLYEQQATVRVGGLGGGGQWSSTQGWMNNAHTQDFLSGRQFLRYKYTWSQVHPVRAF